MSTDFRSPIDNKRDSGVDLDVAPPLIPPPPEVPSGWIARWDERYQRYYYVNLETKASQWETPASSAAAPQPPPYQLYQQAGLRTPSPTRGRNPAAEVRSPSAAVPPQSSHLQPPQQERSRSRSLGARISRFLKPRSPAPRPAYYTPPPSQYFGVAHPQPAYRPPAVGAPCCDNAARGMPPQRRLGGMGLGTAAGLGLGGGFLGGMMLEDAIHDHDQRIYREGLQDGAGYDYDGDYGDYGGSDYGDFGGDFGGGDFGGDF